MVLALKQALGQKDIPSIKRLLIRCAELRLVGDVISKAQALIVEKANEQFTSNVNTLKFYLKQGVEMKNRESIVEVLAKVCVERSLKADPQSAD